MGPLQVLIISDDAAIAKIWGVFLRENQQKVAVEYCLVGKEKEFLAEFPELLVVDLSLRKSNGVKIVSDIRSTNSAPILVFSPINNESYHLELYQAGADECVTKPVSPQLFLAKVNAWLRHMKLAVVQDGKEEKNGITLRPKGRLLTIDGRQIKLSNHEYRVIKLLLENSGHTFSSEEITDRVLLGGRNDPVLIKNIIYRLRKKIETDPKNPRILVTEPHQGYTFRKSF